MLDLESKLDECPQGCDIHDNEKKITGRDGSVERYTHKTWL